MLSAGGKTSIVVNEEDQKGSENQPQTRPLASWGAVAMQPVVGLKSERTSPYQTPISLPDLGDERVESQKNRNKQKQQQQKKNKPQNKPKGKSRQGMVGSLLMTGASLESNRKYQLHTHKKDQNPSLLWFCFRALWNTEM